MLMSVLFSVMFIFLYFSILLMFPKSSLCILICKCANVLVCFVLRHRSVQFFVFFSFSNVHVCFMLRYRSAVQIFCICWKERNFFLLAAFGGKLLASDVHSSVAMDRYVQSWQWIGNISLLTWSLLWGSVSSLEAWGYNPTFLLLKLSLLLLSLIEFSHI